MKTVILLVCTTFLVSFTGHKDKEMNGIWMGYYRTHDVREKVIVKFNSNDKMEFYTGGVDESTKCIGSYKMNGDSILFSYKNAGGQEFIMKGEVNNRMTYVDGMWMNMQESTGSFYLEKQDVEERIVLP